MKRIVGTVLLLSALFFYVQVSVAEDFIYRKAVVTTTQSIPDKYFGEYEQHGAAWGWLFTVNSDGSGVFWTQTLKPKRMDYAYLDAGKSDMRWGVETKNGEIVWRDINFRDKKVKAMTFYYKTAKDGAVWVESIGEWNGKPFIGAADKK